MCIYIRIELVKVEFEQKKPDTTWSFVGNQIILDSRPTKTLIVVYFSLLPGRGVEGPRPKKAEEGGDSCCFCGGPGRRAVDGRGTLPLPQTDVRRKEAGEREWMSRPAAVLLPLKPLVDVRFSF